jgi:hypothetical protein
MVAARRAQVTGETHCALKDIRGLWSRLILSVGNGYQTRPMKMRFATAVLAACLLASAVGCATLDANSEAYRKLPDPCAGKSVSRQDPLCGSPPL